MKTKTLCMLGALAALGVSWSAAQNVPVAPEAVGLKAKSPTTFINLPSILNNDNTESLGVAVGQNGNVMVGWEDDGDGLTDAEGVWTMLSPTGTSVTTDTIQTSSEPAYAGQSITNKFVSYYRPDGSATAGRTSWGPKIKANLFGAGFGMGATSFEIGDEIAALSATQNSGDDFPSVQLVGDTGSPVGVVAGVDAAYASRTGGIRVGDWDYLSNGNVLIVGESRQDADLVDIYSGTAPAHHAIYRIVTPAGVEVKPVSLASETPIDSQIWHGSGVTSNGFAIRFGATDGATVRLFKNDGTPLSTNINLAAATGFPIAGGGGRGDGAGFHGNGKDAYVAVASGTDATGAKEVWVTVLNADGTIRYSKGAFADNYVTLTDPDRVDAAIYPDGRVLVVFDDSGLSGTRIVYGRFLRANGEPAGAPFYVSEIERPDATGLNEARRPRVAWRNGEAAVAWESMNSPEVLPDTGAPTHVVAVRIFSTPGVPVSPESAGLTPKTPTEFINLPSILNNDNTESLGIAVGQSGNVMVGWEDDGDGLTDAEGVWTMLGSSGSLLIPETVQTSSEPDFVGQSITNRFVSYFRPDGSATAGRTSWGPKIKANLFGAGFGMGATSFEIGDEIPALSATQNGGEDFPSVQLVSETGTPVGVVAGVDATYASRAGSIRIGDWDYLSNGNILIVGESRQDADLVDIYGGTDAHHHAIYRIVTPTGAEVKPVALVSQTPIDSQIWHGSGVTANGFAIRFGAPDGGTVRLFQNDGTPASTNINLAAATGFPIAGNGGRGDGAGFHGNGNDAYVAVASGTDPSGNKQVWVTVLNTDGTIRYSKGTFTDVTLTDSSAPRVDAAIAPDGRVLVVANDAGFSGADIVIARFLKANGDPDGPTFYVSEVESVGAGLANPAQSPRVSWRNNIAAVTWQSKNSPEINPATGSASDVVAVRVFDTSGGGGGDQPTINIVHSGNNVTISWPTTFSGFTLQSTTSLTAPITWTPVAGVVNNSVTVSSASGMAFYRLVK